MDTFCRWMENTLPQLVLAQVRFVYSLWFKMVTDARSKSAMSKSLSSLFAGVDASSLVFLFLPVLYRC